MRSTDCTCGRRRDPLIHESMRITLVSNKFPPDVGGGETHLLDLARGLVHRGHSVHVITGSVVPDAEGFTVQSLPSLGRFSSGSEGLKTTIVDLHRALVGSEPEVIHACNHLPILATALVRRAMDCPLVISPFETLERGVRVFDLWHQYDLERAVQSAILAASDWDLWVCGSHAYVQWAIEAGADRSKVRRVPFGVDLELFKPATKEARASARREFGIPDDTIVFGFPSRLVPRKSFETVVLAVGMLGVSRVRILVPLPTGTSDSEYVGRMRRMAGGSSAAGQILFTTEPIVVEQMPTFYAACDYVVQSAIAEGLGIAILEAMAMGVVPITTDIEGHDEVVKDGVTGFLYAAGNHEALADKMRTAIVKGGALRPAAMDFVGASYTTSHMVDGHVAAYAEVMGHREARESRCG